MGLVRYPLLSGRGRDADNLLSRAQQYMAGVRNKRIPACKWIRLAVQRQYDDVQRVGSEDFPYVFDPVEATRISMAIERFRHYKGPFSGRQFLLEPWQLFTNACVFGWVHRETGLRRFRSALIECPRKQGKSFWTSAVALYMLAMDGEPGAEVYTGATTREQAKIVFRDAKIMAKQNMNFCREFGVGIQANRLYVEKTESVLTSLTKEGEANEGLNPSCGIIDEFHAHKKRDLYDVIRLGMGARAEPLLWMITTAGEDLTGACYDVHVRTQNMLDGIVQDDTHFGVIYTIDEGDEVHWKEEWVWEKANPNYGVSVNPNDLREMVKEAVVSPASLGSFLTKRLNIWTAVGARWLNMEKWNAAGKALRMEDYKHLPCYLAFDLASHIDLTSLCAVFKDTTDGAAQYYVFFKHYLPKESITQKQNPYYRGWAAGGHLLLTEGDFIDFQLVKDDIRHLSDHYQVVEVGYDPHKALQMATELEMEGFPMVLIRQSYATFSPTMRYIEGELYKGTIAHDRNTVTTWMAANVKIKKDYKEAIMPTKDKEDQKIDGMVAFIMAMARATALGECVEPSRYETESLCIVGGTDAVTPSASL